MKIQEILSSIAHKDLQIENQDNLSNLGNDQPRQKSPGMLKQFGKSALAGIKQGVNINQNTSLLKGLSAKALRSLNMPASASALDKRDFNRDLPVSYSGDILQNFSVGSTVNHPKFGPIKVKRANMHGVTFDTFDTLGHDLTMSPGQLKTAFGYR